MSYGWLTESSLGPKKPRQIAVPKSSIGGLNALIQRHIKNDDERHELKRKAKKVDPFELQNPGVELRNKIDRKESTLNRRNRRKRMEQKAKLYEQLKEGKLDPGDTSEYLVDFKRKMEYERQELDEGPEPPPDGNSHDKPPPPDLTSIRGNTPEMYGHSAADPNV